MNDVEEITSPSSTSEKLAHIEALLEKETEQSRKLLRSSRFRNILLAAMVAVLAIAAFMLYGSIQNITKEVPAVVSAAHSLIDNTDTAVKDVTGKIDELDIESLNESIEGISSINYKGLNTSIGGLADAVEQFEDFVDTLSHPASAIGSLFGN